MLQKTSTIYTFCIRKLLYRGKYTFRSLCKQMAEANSKESKALKEVQLATLEINGVMARLQSNRMDVPSAVAACMELTDKVDTAAAKVNDGVRQDNAELRQLRYLKNKVVALHQLKFRLRTDLTSAKK